MSVLNLEMAERCLCCRADHGSVVFAMVCTSGLWSKAP